MTCSGGGPSMRLSLRFRLLTREVGSGALSFSSSATAAPEFTAATIGSGEAHVRLVASPRSDSAAFELSLVCFDSAVGNENKTAARLVVGSLLATDEWTTVELATAPGGRLSANGSEFMRCGNCRSGGPVWAFLGEGFLHRDYKYNTGGCVEHDISALHSVAV